MCTTVKRILTIINQSVSLFLLFLQDLTKKDIIQPSVSTFMDTTDTDWFEDSEIAGVQGFSLSTTNGSQGKVMNGVTTLSDSIPSEPNTMVSGSIQPFCNNKSTFCLDLS